MTLSIKDFETFYTVDMDNRGIGYIDSGLGGLTVVAEALKQIPNESVYFVGDEARLPYGPRPHAEIVKFSLQMADFLVKKHDIKILVVACNTATAQALPDLRAHLSIPVIGVIYAGAISGINATRNLHIDIVGTQSTVDSKAYYNTLKSLNANLIVRQKALPDFVQMVEHDLAGTKQAQAAVYAQLHDWVSETVDGQKADALVLGCTHFPILTKEISEACGPDVTIVDPAIAEIGQTFEILKADDALYDSTKINSHTGDTIYTTGSIDRFAKFAKRWLGDDQLTVKELKISDQGLFE